MVGGEAAGPGLEGGQVAVLRLRVAVSDGHVTLAPYSPKKGQRIVPMYDLLLT